MDWLISAAGALAVALGDPELPDYSGRCELLAAKREAEAIREWSIPIESQGFIRGMTPGMIKMCQEVESAWLAKIVTKWQSIPAEKRRRCLQLVTNVSIEIGQPPGYFMLAPCVLSPKFN